jgi:hypothetical protein
MSWKPVAGIPTLQAQVNKRWPKRDKASDGVKGDAAHAARKSDHNPDSRGLVHAVDIDEDLRGSQHDNRWFADQLIAYARMKKAGSARFKNIVYENQVASGTYAKHFWTWRDGEYGHTKHIHVSFSNAGEQDSGEFDVPVLYGKLGAWDGTVPFYDILSDSFKNGEKNKATWRLACRLAELGFYEGSPLPEGRQGFPERAIKKMQEYMGWEKTDDYTPKTHRAIFKQLKLSKNADA